MATVTANTQPAIVTGITASLTVAETRLLVDLLLDEALYPARKANQWIYDFIDDLGAAVAA